MRAAERFTEYGSTIYLHCRGVDIKLPKDSKGLLEQLAADGNVGDVWGVVIVQAVDVFHDAGAVSFDGC